MVLLLCLARVRVWKPKAETVWRQADKYEVPRVAFINKLDREGADFNRVLGEMKDRLSAAPVPIQLPDNPFRGIIDLIKMRMMTFEEEGKNLKEGPVPEELLDEAQFARAEMLETLYPLSDKMMELALGEEDIPNDLVREVLRKGTLERVIQLQPVVCGSALHGIGVQGVLDSVKYYLPSPLERPPVIGTHPKKEKITETRKPDAKEPFSALVFKILPAKTGDLYWVRIYSGELKGNSKENVAQLWQIHATRKDRDGQIESVGTGEIVGLIGPRFAVTGDTLCDQKSPILLESIEFPETVIEMAIEPESTGERTNRDGDRARIDRRANEAGGGAGVAQAAGSDLQGQGKRRDWTDADFRDGRTAS